MIILDSNVWIAYLNENDGLHHQAVTIFESIAEKIIIPEYVLVEVSNILAVRQNHQEAANFLLLAEENQDTTILPSDADFLNEVTTFFRSQDWRRLSFVDVALLYLSQTHTVHTFDKHLARAISKLKKA